MSEIHVLFGAFRSRSAAICGSLHPPYNQVNCSIVPQERIQLPHDWWIRISERSRRNTSRSGALSCYRSVCIALEFSRLVQGGCDDLHTWASTVVVSCWLPRYTLLQVCSKIKIPCVCTAPFRHRQLYSRGYRLETISKHQIRPNCLLSQRVHPPTPHCLP